MDFKTYIPFPVLNYRWLRWYQKVRLLPSYFPKKVLFLFLLEPWLLYSPHNNGRLPLPSKTDRRRKTFAKRLLWIGKWVQWSVMIYTQDISDSSIKGSQKSVCIESWKGSITAHNTISGLNNSPIFFSLLFKWKELYMD